uniref:Uncharacterized protein n=1 Tax=Rhizophagus irregularis (strain DAOM 181602 / DAOM 197198 / MUCL 43194) TaxID=747089 RepID=U9SMM8_RHIID
MTSNTNNNSDQVNAYELHEELLYELLLYKKKDIIAIQKKLGMAVSEGPSINDNTNQTALNQSKKGKTLKDSFGLLFDLVEELKLIQKKIDICGHPILTILHQNMQDLMDVTFGEISLGEIYHLLLYLEWNISLIQDLLDINGYTNQEISEIEADKNAIEYLYISRLGL